MSNLVYPVLPGRAFPSGRAVLPPKVRIRTTPSDREFRSRDALLPRYQYSVPYDWLRTRVSTPELQALVGFYLKVGGPFDSWLYLDPDDNTAAAESFGVGDGATTVWQLLRSFGGFSEPVDAVVGAAEIAINGYSLNLLPNTDWAVSSGGMPNGWSGYASGTTGTVTRSIVDAPIYAGAGPRHALISASALNGAIGLAGYGDVVAGYRYTYSAEQATTGASTVVIEMDWHDSSGGFLAGATSVVAGSGRVSVSGVAPPGAAHVVVYVVLAAAGGISATLKVADPKLGVGSDARYCAYRQVGVAGGVVTISPAPAAASHLTWSGQFYRRCRFLGDRLDTERFMAGLFAAKRVEFISVKG